MEALPPRPALRLAPSPCAAPPRMPGRSARLSPGGWRSLDGCPFRLRADRDPHGERSQAPRGCPAALLSSPLPGVAVPLAERPPRSSAAELQPSAAAATAGAGSEPLRRPGEAESARVEREPAIRAARRRGNEMQRPPWERPGRLPGTGAAGSGTGASWRGRGRAGGDGGPPVASAGAHLCAAPGRRGGRFCPGSHATGPRPGARGFQLRLRASQSAPGEGGALLQGGASPRRGGSSGRAWSAFL